MLDISNLCFNYGKKSILKGFNLHAKEGDFIGILGANGCGKSTLFKCILRILEPTCGQIKLLGKDAKELSAANIAQIISYVPQKTSLMMGLSVKDFVLLGLFSSRKNLFGYSTEEFVKAALMCEKFRLDANQDVRSLSGGEFGRALMARALISEPKIILLDEPTSAMDLQYAASMMQECAQLAAKNITVLAIIHDLNLAAAYCNRFVFIKDQCAKYVGTSELFNQAVLQDVFSLQAEIIQHKDRVLVVY